MSQQGSGWLAAPKVGPAWFFTAMTLWSVALCLLLRSDLGLYLDIKLARPVDFKVREHLGRSPKISESLHIYALDDSTFSKLGTWVLTINEWSLLLSTIAEKKPRAIVIDQMFSKIDDPHSQFDEAMLRLKAIDVPIITGSFITPQPVGYRQVLDNKSAIYSLPALLGQDAAAPIDEGDLPPLVDHRRWFVYGPHADVLPVFKQVGHFLYPGSGRVAPFIRTGDSAVMPHLTMLVAKERRIANRAFWLDNQRMPLDDDGYLTVNFLPVSKLYNATRSMKGLLEKAFSGKPTSMIKAGDVVLILPQMYTGNTDFKSTPFGDMPGGFVLGALLNSVLTGQWLTPVSAPEILVVVLVFLGGTLGLLLNPLSFWLGMSLGLLMVVGVSVSVFTYLSIAVPWSVPALGFLLASLTIFTEKVRVGEKKAQVLRMAFEGALAPDELKVVMKNPEQIKLEARERVVTLMFIDVVGFSLLAENMLPRIAFENLKRLLSTIGEVVHQYGGIIDKTLGDGLLCYFGYRFDGDSSAPDHAEKALRCAIKIQEENLRRNIEAAANGEPVYPLRVGINTASCYLGDLGSGNRIDFTVVGNGVNFAKRLEGACEMHSVMFGATTYDLVKGVGLRDEAINKRYIRIKHHSELVEAYEFDPFYDQQKLRMVALEGFRKCANIDRIDQRWPVHDPSKIQLVCDFGPGQLINFSHTGLSVRLDRLLPKGSRLNVSLDGAGGALKSLLAKDNIEYLQGEVRWGYEDAGGYVHGLLLTNITEVQSDALVQYLCEFAFARDMRQKADEGATEKEAS